MAGWAPSNLEAAYNLPSSSKGSGQVVAIVDAYDNPNVASDLAAYRSYFGLSTANSYKYNQEGQQSNYPSGDHAWGLKIDLDVEMVSASCPNCAIYLIEADNPDTMGAAEIEAVKLGAHIVSNSWICYSCGGSSSSQSGFDSPGVTYLAGAGDHGYGTGSPADLATVIAVGGTVLAQSGSKYNEIVWTETGAGCASTEDVEKPLGSTIQAARTGRPTTSPPSLRMSQSTTAMATTIG